MKETLALVATLTLILGCQDDAPPPAPAIEMAANPTPAPPPIPTPTPTPTPVEVAPAEEAAPTFTRSGEIPAGQGVLAALGAEGVDAQAMLGRPLEVGDGRFIVVATTGGNSPELHVAVVSDNAGGAQLEHHLPLTFETDIDAESEPPRIAAREVKDFDGDSESEAFLLVRFMTPPERAIGESQIGHYILLDLDPQLSIAISMETQRARASAQTRGAVIWRDANADGHDDFTVRVRDCYEDDDAPDGETCDRSEVVRHYDPATDSFPAG